MGAGGVISTRSITSEADWLAWRRQDVTASDVAALFGLHPYKTMLELWAEKSGVDLGKKESSVMRRGRIMEPAVAEAVRIERPEWMLSPRRSYTRDDKIRVGATPDFDVVRVIRMTKDGFGADYARGLLQAKTVSPSAFDEHWTAESPPFWVVLQAQTELMLHPEAEFCAVAALIIDPWRFDVAIYETEPHKESHERIARATVDFWERVEDGRQPQADYDRDGRVLAALYPRERIERPDVDMSADARIAELLRARRSLVTAKRDNARRLGAINTELKAKLRDAESGYGPKWRITWKTQERKPRFDSGGPSRVLRVTDHTGKTEVSENGDEDQGSGPASGASSAAGF